MNRNTLKQYAPQARRDCIAAVTDRAAYYGLTAQQVEPITVAGDVAIIAGRALPRKVAEQRQQLAARIARQGFEQVIEAVAYTWFNRLVAIRFMELHGYLEHGYRVLSPSPHRGEGRGEGMPEILEHAEHIDLPGLDSETVIELKLDGTREAELYRLLLIAQCNALHAAMPFLFERIDDETELLLPDNLLHSDSLIRKLVHSIDEEDWREVEIIGWLYQFYISEKKDQVIGKVVKSEDIPAATQLFTPNWIVKYLVQNSLGRQWLATYPNSPLKQQMEYYIEPAEQTPEVQVQLQAITPESLNPEELTLLDPACGSGHILVEAYDLFKAIYQERGYRARDIPSLILQKNLYGLEIDDRAAQLAAFALMMKARADDRRIFSSGLQPHVLAIQESKGLDAQQITEALNRLLDGGEKQRQKGDIAQADVAQLIGLFEHGKTFGSLIRVPEELAKKLPAIAERVQDVLAYGGMLEQAAARSLRPLIEQARILADRYDAVVTNPPYMGNLLPNLKAFALHEFPRAKADLCVTFIERLYGLARPAGHVAMVTMQAWMFLSTFKEMRPHLLLQKTIETMAHLGARAFSAISGEVVQTTMFALRNDSIPGFVPVFFRLTEGDENEKNALLRQRKNRFANASQDDLAAVPSSPLAYWLTHAFAESFRFGKPLGEVVDIRAGITTGNNEQFVRYWHEVDRELLACRFDSKEQAWESSANRWFPLKKGGPFRKWYGNNDNVIRFDRQAYNILKRQGNHCASESYYFRESLTWSDISTGTFGVRYCDNGAIFTTVGHSVFGNWQQLYLVAALLCSRLADEYVRAINPTLHANPGDVAQVPYIEPPNSTVTEELQRNTARLIDLAQYDWNSLEEAPGFQTSSFATRQDGELKVAESWTAWCEELRSRFVETHHLESCNNKLLASVYGLTEEIDCQAIESEITLSRPNREEDTKRLISYAIGCMMGRYSLDKPGLIYAHSGNKDFDPDQYQTFPADDDGIIPIMETDWFPDDASNRLVEFISVAWPKEHLAENLTFIADSLGSNRNEQPRDTIRRYLATGFYKHHLSMYKRRPIYWLFSSGKQRAFQCLVYLHRYHEGTLSRMRTEYVIPLQGKMASRLDQLADDIAAASSTSHRKKLEKERDTLRKQHTELQAFDEQLRHYADRRISLDLDDGVKVNYGKFGDVLAEVKAVTGGTEES